MRAIGKHIVIIPINEETKSGSGLIMSGDEMDEMRYKKGKVVSAGFECNHITEESIVYYDKAAGHKARLNGDTVYTIIEERDIVICL